MYKHFPGALYISCWGDNKYEGNLNPPQRRREGPEDGRADHEEDVDGEVAKAAVLQGTRRRTPIGEGTWIKRRTSLSIFCLVAQYQIVIWWHLANT